MIATVIKREGEDFVVTIPPVAMERNNLRIGDTILFGPFRRGFR